MNRRLRIKRNRAGYVLVLFAMMFLGLLGLAALVIDMGFARLAQRQMQTAVDSAALEGLRWQGDATWEDLPPAWLADPNFQSQVGPPGTGPLSPQQIDKVRRWAASQVVADGPVESGSSAQPSMFADNVDTSGGTVHYGAGPVVNFSGGIGPANLAAAQTMALPIRRFINQRARMARPGLELNPSNTIAGDMSSGTYGINTNYNPTQLADEDANYNRRDYVPGTLSGTSTSSAFLVRMRRTNNVNGLDQQSGHQFRRSDPAHSLWPRQHDGPQRQSWPTERGVRGHGPRHGHRRSPARQNRRPPLFQQRRRA